MDVRGLLELYVQHQLFGRASYPTARRLVHSAYKAIQDIPVETLTPLQISAWRNGLASTPTHATKALRTLRAAYTWAHTLGLVACRNPTSGIKGFPGRKRQRRLSALEWEQARAALAHRSLKFQVFCLTVFLVSCRPKEARLMQWAHLRLEGPDPIWWKPITKNGEPQEVPLPTQLAKALRLLPRSGPYVFPGQEPLTPWSDSSVRAIWRRFRLQAGIPDAWLYDLRRSCASNLLNHGENLLTIQNLLNHVNPTCTAIYARVDTSTVRRAVQDHADRYLPVELVRA